MISNVAPPTTETAGVAATAAGDSADSGVFDVLLNLQSQASASAEVDADTAAATAPPVALGGADLLGTLEDSAEEPADDVAELTEDAFWFLNALLPQSRVAAPVTGESSLATQARHGSAQPGVAAPPPSTAPTNTATDLAQAFASSVADADAGDSRVPTSSTSAGAAPVVDTTNWNSLTGPAEFFAHTSKHSTVERAESAPMTTHVRDPRWADDLGNRLASMVRTGESSASLQLTPVDLGPLEVNVSVKENQATVHFGASNAETRALLEASMPRLREMLASQGFQLMDSSVSHGFARQTRHEAAGTPRLADEEVAAQPVQAIHIRGMLDLYA